MAVRVILDTPQAVFTNLDFVSGKVVLSLATDTPISSIVVKLEGESRTRLVGLKYPENERSDKKRTEIEVHKLLYKVTTVLSGREAGPEQGGPTAYHTLLAGTYEYPFRFKLPFNNDCINNSRMANVNVGGLRLEVARPPSEHVKKTLPPSLSGFPEKAEIRYYVKATVVRPQFYKENYRGIADFKLFPIEPPRKVNPTRETFARRQHQFSKLSLQPEKKSFFQRSSKTSQVDDNGEPPLYCVDVRLPSPAILTCNEPLPLRILVRKLNNSSEIVSLQLLQIELIGYTHIRAHDFKEVEAESVVILSKSNMKFPLGNGTELVGKEWALDPSMWNALPLPSSVAPSFDTCNISRTYKLGVRAGLSHGRLSGRMKPELMVIPLQLDVQVYSGIAPPRALLDAMGVGPPPPPPVVSETPTTAIQPPRPQLVYPPEQLEQEYMDAPPSYEDAIAESLGPVDGPRREYNPPNSEFPTTSWTGTDDYHGSAGDHKDERLFPNSEPLRVVTGPADSPASAAWTNSPPISSAQESPNSPVSHQAPGRATERLEPPFERPVRRLSPSLGVPNRKPVPSQQNKSDDIAS